MQHEHEQEAMPRLLKPAAVARLLDIGQRTLWRWVSIGTFPRPDFRQGGKVVRWKASTVAGWINTNASGRGAA